MYIVNLSDSPIDVVPVSSISLYRYLVNYGLIPVGVIYGSPSFENTALLKEKIAEFKKEVYISESDS